MTTAPDTLPLPHQLFLLSHHAAKAGLDDDSAAVRGVLLRAAAVAQLRGAGLLRDHDGRAERTGTTPPAPLDPFLARVLDAVPRDRDRRWSQVLEDESHEAERAVRDQLAGTGAITVQRRRVLGVFPTHRIGVADPERVDALRDRVRRAVRGGSDPAAVPIPEAVLALLAVEGNVSTVFGWRALWGRRTVVRALFRRVDRELPGLRAALSASVARHRAAG